MNNLESHSSLEDIIIFHYQWLKDHSEFVQESYSSNNPELLELVKLPEEEFREALDKEHPYIEVCSLCNRLGLNKDLINLAITNILLAETCC